MTRDRPDILVFPPLAFAAALLAAILLGRWLPLGLLSWIPRPAGLIAGSAIIAIGLLSAASGIVAFRRAGTNVNPHQPALTVVRGGVYRFTRNPMYLGMILVVAGYGVAAGTLWGPVAAVLLWAVLHHGVVLREETYLEAKFGDDYRALCRATRRWL